MAGATERRRPNGGDELLPVPSKGRVHRDGRKVRLGDVDPTGRLRLDALARYLQDISGDDSEESGVPDAHSWIVRRTVLEQRAPARIHERLELATFCSGYGSRWAERRVALLGAGGASIDAATVWVHVDPATGRPRRLPPEFHEVYGVAADGREVVARNDHEPVEPDGDGVETFRWQPRTTDLDLIDHVNNAIAWAVVEQVCARLLVAAGGARGGPADRLAAPFRAEVEFRDAVERAAVDAGDPLLVAHRADGDGLSLTLWSADGAAVHQTARVQPLGESTRP